MEHRNVKCFNMALKLFILFRHQKVGVIYSDVAYKCWSWKGQKNMIITVEKSREYMHMLCIVYTVFHAIQSLRIGLI